MHMRILSGKHDKLNDENKKQQHLKLMLKYKLRSFPFQIALWVASENVTFVMFVPRKANKQTH